MRMVNRLPGEQYGGKTYGWGHSVSLTPFLVYQGDGYLWPHCGMNN